MKKWMKIISPLLVAMILLPIGIVALAVDNTSTEEMSLAGLNNISVTHSANRYFEERADYLLGETTIMNWSVSGIVNDETAHKTQYEEKGITLLDVSYAVESVACFDAHAEASIVETVYYSKKGAVGEEVVAHTLTLYLGNANTPVVAADAYKEEFSNFTSCSYVDMVTTTRSTTTASGSAMCIVEIAKGELGTEETGDNMTKYGEWYGLNGQPWCAMFISWCANEANVNTSIIEKTASSGAMMHAFIEQDKFYYSAANGGFYTPVAGDILFVGTVSNGPSHVGIVEKVENGNVWIYDGNYSDRVNYHCYALTASNIVGYGNPAYGSNGHVFSGHDFNETCHWQECTICGYTTNEQAHNVRTIYSYNLSDHWYSCTICGIMIDKVKHDLVLVEDLHYKCAICGCHIYLGK